MTKIINNLIFLTQFNIRTIFYGLMERIDKLKEDIKVAQEDFNERLTGLNGKLDGINTALDNEQNEIKQNVESLTSQIAILKSQQIDTSGLDALGERMTAMGTRIGGLVSPVAVQTETAPIIPEIDGEASVDAATPVTNVEAVETVETQPIVADAAVTESANVESVTEVSPTPLR